VIVKGTSVANAVESYVQIETSPGPRKGLPVQRTTLGARASVWPDGTVAIFLKDAKIGDRYDVDVRVTGGIVNHELGSSAQVRACYNEDPTGYKGFRNSPPLGSILRGDRTKSVSFDWQPTIRVDVTKGNQTPTILVVEPYLYVADRDAYDSFTIQILRVKKVP
jgi:hypothetical protein